MNEKETPECDAEVRRVTANFTGYRRAAEYIKFARTLERELTAANARISELEAANTRMLREVFSLCEATQNECGEKTDAFLRGRNFEAKGIARAIHEWFQSEFCGASFMGEPVIESPMKKIADAIRDGTFNGVNPLQPKAPL